MSTPSNLPTEPAVVPNKLSEPRPAHKPVEVLLAEVTELLHKQKLVENLVDRQSSSTIAERANLVHEITQRQHETELRQKLEHLHAADVAYILEGLPLEERLAVWNLVKAERDGEILLETSDAVRESLIASMASHELVAAAETLDTDEIADLAPDLPAQVMEDILESQDIEERAELQSALSYAEGTVGALMDFEEVAVQADVNVEAALNALRVFDALPGQTDAIFVVNARTELVGVLPLHRVLVSNPEVSVESIAIKDALAFTPDQDADEVATAFERYDLICAPVVDKNNKLVGRVTVDAVMDFVREQKEAAELAKVGLREEEDIFASVWKSAKNRWTWLAINLVTAFVASRVIGSFEGSIAKLAALAALMPIVAGIGGNSGNQTTTLLIRALALGQVNRASVKRLVFKELAIATINGIVWGSLVGLLAYFLYNNIALGLVMWAAMFLNLVVAATAGMAYPLYLDRIGRDPAFGAGVLLTATTDSMGFFIFLSLATVFLV